MSRQNTLKANSAIIYCLKNLRPPVCLQETLGGAFCTSKLFFVQMRKWFSFVMLRIFFSEFFFLRQGELDNIKTKTKNTKVVLQVSVCKIYFHYCNIKLIIIKINGLCMTSNQTNNIIALPVLVPGPKVSTWKLCSWWEYQGNSLHFCFLLACLKITWSLPSSLYGFAWKGRCYDGRKAVWRQAPPTDVTPRQKPSSAAETVELTDTEVSLQQQIHKHTHSFTHAAWKMGFLLTKMLAVFGDRGKSDKFHNFLNYPCYFIWVLSMSNPHVKKIQQQWQLEHW